MDTLRDSFDGTARSVRQPDSLWQALAAIGLTAEEISHPALYLRPTPRLGGLMPVTGQQVFDTPRHRLTEEHL